MDSLIFAEENPIVVSEPLNRRADAIVQLC